MTSKELDSLVTTGLLKAEPGDQNEFDGLVDSARKRIADAQNTNLSQDSQFDLAYNAAHAFALAAMRWHGYRPDKRFVVFQSLAHTLSLGPEVWRVLDRCHRIRNSVEYEGYHGVDRQLLADLLAATKKVEAGVTKLGPVVATKRK
jgi:hypothetical protein